MNDGDLEKLKEELEKIYQEKCWSDDPEFMVCDYASGNVDDAYYGGVKDGEILFARHLLNFFVRET